MDTATLFQIQSFLVLALMTIGICFRKQRKKHVKIMGLTILWDILLIFQIEFGRNAILKASNAIHNTMMLNIHVTLAVLTVLFYIGLIKYGRKLLKGQNQYKKRHKVLGWGAFILRILVVITSFWAVSPVKQ